MDARPQLWVEFATALAVTGQFTRVEHKLRAAEAALQGLPPSVEMQVLVDRIADLRALAALLAADPRQIEMIISQSRRKLEHLHDVALPGRAAGYWKLGLAYQLQGDRAAARHAQVEAITSSEATGNNHINVLATTGLGYMQELDGQLDLATTTYRRVLHLVGQPPGPIACEAYVGLAGIFYEWNNLDPADEYGQLSVRLARQLDIASFVSSELFLARLSIARGDTAAAIAILDRTEQDVLERKFLYRIPQIVALQAFILIRRGDLEAAARLIAPHDLPLSEARIHLARGEPARALAVLEPFRQHVEARGWTDERLRILMLQAIARKANGEHQEALQLVHEVLAQGEAEGFIRVFVDEGLSMAKLLSEANAAGIKKNYTGKLLAAFANERRNAAPVPETQRVHSSPYLTETLSRRELEVLHLVAEGLSNKEISERLFLSLATVKGHNRVIFRKLQVERRTEAIARGRELGLL